MILEYKLDNRSNSLVYEKIFLRVLSEFNLKGNIQRDGFMLKLYVEADEAEELESFATALAEALPHTIFLHGTEATVVDSMHKEQYVLPKAEKLAMPFCPKCAKDVLDEKSANYYNIFTKCDVCGYDVDGEAKSYKSEITEMAECIKDGKTVELNTLSGQFYVAMPSSEFNEVEFNALAYDLYTIEKYTYAEEWELRALAAIEKPLIKLKTKLSFTMNYEEIKSDLIAFKIADNMLLNLLMQELHGMGVDLVLLSEEELHSEKAYDLVDTEEEFEPLEVVVSENSLAIVSGERSLPQFPITAESVEPALGSFYSVLKEHKIESKNVIGLNLSKDYKNNILVHGQKFGTVSYLEFDFNFNSMEDIFEQIVATNESGEKIVQNYKKAYPEDFEKILKIKFEEKKFNIFTLWGIVSMVLDYSDSTDPYTAATVLENNAITFLGNKGPSVDYRLERVNEKPSLDPLMVIRSSMSFRLAGVDTLTLSYGVIESFMTFLSNEIDEIKQNMGTEAVAVTGSLLGNKKIFSKISQEFPKNHSLYFNNELSVDGVNMFYGGVSL